MLNDVEKPSCTIKVYNKKKCSNSFITKNNNNCKSNEK